MSKSKKIKFVTNSERDTYEMMQRIEEAKKVNDRRILKTAMEENHWDRAKAETYVDQVNRMRSGGKTKFKTGAQRNSNTTEDAVMKNLFGGKKD
jgi:hypothetical protein